MAEGRVLVVEDEHIVAMGIKKMLKSLGYQVTGIASTGEDAISKAESTFPDLVLMDIMLKGNVDGIEAAREIIKADPEATIVAVTASDRKVDREACIKAGMKNFLLKPFSENDLFNVLFIY